MKRLRKRCLEFHFNSARRLPSTNITCIFAHFPFDFAVSGQSTRYKLCRSAATTGNSSCKVDGEGEKERKDNNKTEEKRMPWNAKWAQSHCFCLLRVLACGLIPFVAVAQLSSLSWHEQALFEDAVFYYTCSLWFLKKGYSSLHFIFAFVK